MENNMEYQPQVAPQAKQKKGKTAIVVLGVVIALLVAVIGVVGAMLAFNASTSHEDIVAALENGKYSDACSMYEKKYGYGNTDKELTGALEDRLIALEDEFVNGEVTYNKAIKEIETIREMGIKTLQQALDKAEATINAAAAEPTTQKAAPQVNLVTEPLPEIPPVSYSPYIKSATTLNGTVLGASDVNAARSFGANKAIDGYFDSCWCVNTSNPGAAGASIRFDLGQRSLVTGIMLVNGNLYHSYDGLFHKNGQIERFTLTFSDGSKQSFYADFNSSASDGYQTIYLDRPVETEYITLTVDSGYVGTSYTTNVCLGEFKVF
ncbi:MAG: discoidin domain-containing protein [Clostridia bacterium]|nr:discoidin domain-containing protein [Clostridia bacterium]